jgi:hypothetical protein
MCFILQEEKRKKDLKFQQCTIKLMELLARGSRNIETICGQFNKTNIDSDTLKKKFLKVLAWLYIQNE